MNGGTATIRVGHILATALLALAFWLRVSRLAYSPLTDSEAEAALAVAAAAGNGSPGWEADPVPERPAAAYHTLTGLIFLFVGPGDTAARLIPALAGAALVLVPLLAVARLGGPVAFLTSLLYVISPSLWTVSRTAGGTILAALGLMVVLMLSLGLHRSEDRPGPLYWAAAGLAILLASGPSALTGVLGVGAGAAGYSAWSRRARDEKRGAARADPASADPLVSIPWAELTREQRQRTLVTGSLVLLALATGFGFVGSGMAQLFEAPAAWLRGFAEPAGASPAAMLVMLVAYEPIILAFGLVGGVLAFKRGGRLGRALLSWTLGSAVVLAMYPGRQPEDLIWMVLPLGLLGAQALAELLDRLGRPKDWWLVGGFALAALALLAFAHMQLTGYVNGLGSLNVQLDFALQLGLAIMAIGVIVVALFILGFGWGWGTSAEAAGIAASLTLLVLTFAAGWQLNFTPLAASSRELLRPQANGQGLRLLSQTLATLSQFETGEPHALPLSFLDAPTAALAWELRRSPLDQPASATEPPAVVLTREGPAEPSLPGEYLGQSIVIGDRWPGASSLPPNLVTWLIAREAPVDLQRWIMMVRADIAGVGQMVSEEPEPES